MIHKKLSRLILSTALLGLYAAGCNTGGPQVTTTVPAASATDVAVTSTISATFSTAMDAATIDTATFVINSSGGSSIDGTISYDTATNTATFTPTNPLNEGTTYSATITTDVTSTDSDPLAANFTWDFTTTAPPGSWLQIGGQVSPSGAESQDPRIMLFQPSQDSGATSGDTPGLAPKNLSGTTTLAVGYRHASFMMNLNFWDGSSWGASEDDPALNRAHQVYHGPAYCTDGTSLYTAFSRDGAALQVNDIDFYNRIFVYKWNSGTGWQVQNNGNEVSLELPPNDSNAWEATIDCRPSGGDPVVAWVEAITAPESDDVYVADVGALSSTRSGPLNRNSTSGSFDTRIRTVGITTDDTNTYIGLWEDHHNDQERSDLFVSSYDGANFTDLGASIGTSFDQNNLSSPSLAKDTNDLYIAYVEINSVDDTGDVFVQRWDGASWTLVGGGPVSAFDATADHFTSDNPTLLLVGDVLYLAWEESSQTEGEFIFVAHWDEVAGAWVMDGERLNVDQDNTAHNPSLAYDATDMDLYVAFEEFVDGFAEIFVKKLNIGTDILQ